MLFVRDRGDVAFYCAHVPRAVAWRDRGDGALCCAHVPRREPSALVSSFTSLHRTPHRPDPAPSVFAWPHASVRPGASGGGRSEVKEEQLCSASSGLWVLSMLERVPDGLVSEHGIEDGQQLAHAGGDSDLGGLACADQAAVEEPDDRVVADGGQGGHIQHRAHFAAPTANAARSLALARVVGQWCDAHELGDLATLQPAELGESRSQRQDRHRPDALDAVQQLALVLEVPIQMIVGLLVDLADLRIEQPEHALDAAIRELGGVLHTVSLGHAHVHELPATCHERGQLQPFGLDGRGDVPVSYTHLTLPTIYSV